MQKMIVRERDILADEKVFVEKFLEALNNNDIMHFLNSLCKETRGFLKGVAAATGMEELYVVEVCMEDIRNRCELIFNHDEIKKVGIAVVDNCEFVNVGNTLIFLLSENGECKVDYLKDLDDYDDLETNINLH